jgi:hypothetical protein
MNTNCRGPLGLLSLALLATTTHAAPDPPLLPPTPETAAWLLDGSTAEWTSGRPDGHAPIGVMGDHVHHAGEWMFSYRFMRMIMDGSRNGTSGVSDAKVLQDFLVTPTRMTMDMHMLGAMHALSDDWTLMVMVPLLQLKMHHVTRTAVTFTTESEGLGDIKLSGMRRVWHSDGQTAHLNLGLSVPTGSIDETDDTPMTPGNQEAQLPYPMQLGSGTWDLQPGLTWLGESGDRSWGAQALLTLRTGENANDYRLGNRQDLTSWVARRLDRNWSVSFRLGWSHWSDIHGADPKIPQLSGGTPIVPTADPGLRNGSQVDAAVGVNLYGREGAVKGHRLALEIGAPIYQDLDGPQLETDLLLTLGWQLSL